MKTMIFLGAGASKADGAPLQGELFRDYFVMRNNADWPRSEYCHQKMEQELSTFFQLIFGVDTGREDIDRVSFPTFEEALGMLDLAEQRYESFLEFGFEDPVSESSRLRMIRVYLIHMMAYVLDRRLQHYSDTHGLLIRNLKDSGSFTSVSFLSTNYDILIDNVVSESPFFENGKKIDYGIELSNYSREHDWSRPLASATRLHKVHGSLNWFYCPCCNTIELTPFLKGVPLLLSDPKKIPCKTCESPVLPIIVPPTYFKNMTNNFLTRIWANAEQDLRDCEHVIFCGYSFPDADIHIKYLLKRAQTKRRFGPPLQFTVVNNHDGKLDSQKDEEKSRFCRFLGGVRYLKNWSFQDFARNPGPVIEHEVAEVERPA